VSDLFLGTEVVDIMTAHIKERIVLAPEIVIDLVDVIALLVEDEVVKITVVVRERRKALDVPFPRNEDPGIIPGMTARGKILFLIEDSLVEIAVNHQVIW
jgi:hypothetical protein